MALAEGKGVKIGFSELFRFKQQRPLQQMMQHNLAGMFSLLPQGAFEFGPFSNELLDKRNPQEDRFVAQSGTESSLSAMSEPQPGGTIIPDARTFF